MSVERIEMASLHEAARLAHWNEVCRETFAEMTTTPCSRGNFSANISRAKIGSFGLTWVESTPIRVDFPGCQVGKRPEPAGGCYLLTLQYSGICSGMYRGQDFSLKPGDMFLGNISNPQPWYFASHGPIRAMTIKIPAHTLFSFGNYGDFESGLVIAGSTPQSRMAFLLFTALREILEDDPDEYWYHNQEEVIFSIVKSLLEKQSNIKLLPMQPHRKKARAFIEQRLADPDLTVIQIAAHVGTSLRTLQRAFLHTGMTVQRYILSRRIALAADRLRRPCEWSSIADVAFSAGFNDLSHFSRTFRQATGVSPRKYRFNTLL